MANEKSVFKQYRNTSPTKRGKVSKFGKALFLKSLLKKVKNGS
jgi:hypothetical protein